jgi:type I restriction enzyme S subunit
MTPQELKNSILQLAIQGKLVEQRPEEGKAAELYKQIQAEKQALIKAGKIKKEKPLPEIAEDEVPFEIPESWMWVRFGECGTLKSGYAFKSNEYSASGIQVVRISDLAENIISCKDAVYYPQAASMSSYQFELFAKKAAHISYLVKSHQSA